MVALSSKDGVYRVTGPMCRWKLVQRDEEGEAYVRKETGWLTNSRRLAQLLGGVCENQTGGPWHRHLHLVGGARTRAAQVYPPALVQAVLESLRDQLVENGGLNAVDLLAAGHAASEAQPIDAEMWEDFFWDDVNGGYLSTSLMRAARALEIDWLRKENVYTKVPRATATSLGLKPIPLLWIDTNRGDTAKPLVRSRLVVREFKNGNRGHPSLPAADLFTAMPPLEALKVLCSSMVTDGLPEVSADPGDLHMAHFDISRALHA